MNKYCERCTEKSICPNFETGECSYTGYDRYMKSFKSGSPFLAVDPKSNKVTFFACKKITEQSNKTIVTASSGDEFLLEDCLFDKSYFQRCPTPTSLSGERLAFWTSREDENGYLYCTCSNCGFMIENYIAVEIGVSSTDFIGVKYNYCPKCGYKMGVKHNIKLADIVDNAEPAFSKDDYVVGIEVVGTGSYSVAKRVHGWVNQIMGDYIAIQADDSYDGARGTLIKFSTARKLAPKPRPNKGAHNE